MGSVPLNIFTIIISMEFIMGNLGNGFIVLVNFLDLINSRKVSVADHLLTTLAISRFALLWVLFIYWWRHMFYPSFFLQVTVIRIMYNIWVVSCHFSMWLATGLSIFYFLKIANFSNSIFLYFKWRVKKVISVVLLLSLVLLLLQLLQTNTYLDIVIDEYKGNISGISNYQKFIELSKSLLFINVMFIFIAFTPSLMTFLMLIFSLWKHLKKMHHNVQGSRDVSTMAHIKALQGVVIFLLLYTIFFLSIFIEFWRFSFPNSVYSYFSEIGEIAFPALHSFVLIMGNSKLKQAYRSVFKRLRF